MRSLALLHGLLVFGPLLGCADLIELDRLKDFVGSVDSGSAADVNPDDVDTGMGFEAGPSIDGSGDAGPQRPEGCPPSLDCTPPSCANLPATCGSAESCCLATPIRGGPFSRGYDASNSDSQDSLEVFGWAARGAGAATVSDFLLDKYEVTVGRFRKFIDAYDDWRRAGNPQQGRGGHPRFKQATGWQLAPWASFIPESAADFRSKVSAASSCPASFRTWTDAPQDHEDLPVNCITWYEAFLFCIWDGGRLPTDVEWNYAAAGGDLQRAFPWSDPPNDHTIHPTDAIYARDTGALNLARPGSIGGRDGYWGHRDLAGNVWEWVFDACESCEGPTHDSPELSQYPLVCGECPSVTGDKRYFRGGSWKFQANTLRSAFRAGISPEVRYDDLGMRCARDPIGAP
jgi:formylglycine-generating enzyme required for sulfatase activity